MSKVYHILFMPANTDESSGSATWVLGSAHSKNGEKLFNVTADLEANHSDIADTLVSRLEEEGYSGEPIVLALPSSWCLAAQISLDGLPRRDRYSAMCYRLETFLPTSAEDMTCGFTGSRQSALGVAVATRRVKPWIDALESRGVQVGMIAPAAVMDCGGLHDEVPDRIDEAVVLVRQINGLAEIFVQAPNAIRVESRQLISWFSGLGDVSTLNRHLRLIENEWGSSPRVIIELDDPELATEFEPLGQVTVVPAYRQAIALIERALEGRLTRGVNLRQGALEADDPWRHLRPAMQRFVWAAILLLATATGLFTWQAGVYQAQADDAEQALKSAYREQITTGTVPVDILGRLRSLVRQASAGGGARGQRPPVPNELATLQVLLEKVPGDLRIRFNEVFLEGGEIDLEGEARSNTDVDRVASAINAGGLLRFDAPATQRLSQGPGVRFSITGRRVSVSEKDNQHE